MSAGAVGTAGVAPLPEVIGRIRAVAAGEQDPVALMATISCELYHGVEGYDWVGFYRVVGPEMLRIGPYQGTHGCLTIPFSRGVCGRAAREDRTQIVDDVDAIPDHIACSATTRSEIVVPVRDNAGRLIAVLDIDSDRPARFGREDADLLEGMVAEIFGDSETVERDPRRKTPRGIRRIVFEDDVFYGPVLLLAHLAIGLLGWPIEALIAAPGSSPAEVIACAVIALGMMVPVFLIIRAYFHGKVEPLPTVLYMLAHACLIIVGYAGIYSMLEYGPGGGLPPEGADPLTSCVPGGMTDFYFSLITFSTVGYGDCTPYGWARIFAGLEGLLSYFFVGITLGLMTGIAPTERRPR